jgi:hypothetical protein
MEVFICLPASTSQMTLAEVNGDSVRTVGGKHIMHALGDINGEELRWIKPARLKLRFELRAGETVVATLGWTGSYRAVAQWADAQYRFSREGWFRPRVVVRGASANATDEPVAVFAYRGGALTFPDGRAFVWEEAPTMDQRARLGG